MKKNSTNFAKSYLVLKNGKKIFTNNSTEEIKTKMNNEGSFLYFYSVDMYGVTEVKSINKADVLYYERIKI